MMTNGDSWIYSLYSKELHKSNFLEVENVILMERFVITECRQIIGTSGIMIFRRMSLKFNYLESRTEDMLDVAFQEKYLILTHPTGRVTSA